MVRAVFVDQVSAVGSPEERQSLVANALHFSTAVIEQSFVGIVAKGGDVTVAVDE